MRTITRKATTKVKTAAAITPVGLTKATKTGKTEDAAPACIANDNAFRLEIRKHVKKAVESKMEVGRLIYHYRKANGYKYGDRIFPHIADLAGISLRCARYYHDYYRLTVEFSDCANLPNLSLSAKYEIARLFKHANPTTAIPVAIEQAALNKWTVSEVAANVRDILHMANKHRPASIKKDSIQESANEFGAQQQSVIKECGDVLSHLCRKDCRILPTINMSEHLTVVRHVCNAMLEYLERLVKTGEGYSLELDIKKMARRANKLSDDIQHTERKAS